MKTLKEEIHTFYLHSRYSKKYKKLLITRLRQFLDYLAQKTNASIDDIHLEQIYETVGPSGQSLFFSSLDVDLLDQYFLEHLHKNYNWLQTSRTALNNFFLYLYRKYDFPVLTEQMTFNLDDYKQKPTPKDKLYTYKTRPIKIYSEFN